MTTIDLTAVFHIFGLLTMAVVTPAIPIVVPALLKRWGSANNADLTNNLENVLQAAAGGVYKYATSHEGGLSNIAVHEGALADATNYVLTSLPGTLQKLNITPEKVTQMVSKRLGALLATDPTVTAGTPPAAAPTGIAAVAPVVAAAPPVVETAATEPAGEVVTIVAPATEAVPKSK